MSEPASKNPEMMIVTLTVAELRCVVREEIKAATNGNGHSPTLLSAEQAAQLLHVPKTWVLEMARQGRLKSVRLGHYVRFKPEDLEEFIRVNGSA